MADVQSPDIISGRMDEYWKRRPFRQGPGKGGYGSCTSDSAGIGASLSGRFGHICK